MSVIRNGLFVAIGIVLFLSLLVGNIFLTLGWSVNYDVLQPELKSVIKEVSSGQVDLSGEINAVLPLMTSHCQDNSEYLFDLEDYTLVIPCEVVLQGSDAVIDYGIDSLTKEIYYQDYDCEFLDCFGETGSPFFLVSQKAHDYWMAKFYLFLFITIILAILMFFVSEHKGNFMVVFGLLMVASALPFAKLQWFASFFLSQADIFSSLFVKSSIVFWIFLILGGVIALTGVALHFLNFGNFVSEKLQGKKKVEVVVEPEDKVIVKKKSKGKQK